MNLASALASALLVTATLACSKSQEVQPLPGSTDSVDPTLAETPADRCFVQCDKDFAAGDAKFNVLDACVEEKCKIEPEPTTPRAACAPLDQGTITYGHPIADHCIARDCCAQAIACADDPGCSGMSACFNRCSAMR